MHSSVKLARYSVYLFWFGLLVNIIVLVVLVIRLTQQITPISSSSAPSSAPSTPSSPVDLGGVQPVSVITNKLNYTCSSIGSSRLRRPFFQYEGKILTLGDYWQYGKILTITPYRIISSISPTEFYITQYEQPAVPTAQSTADTQQSFVPQLFNKE